MGFFPTREQLNDDEYLRENGYPSHFKDAAYITQYSTLFLCKMIPEWLVDAQHNFRDEHPWMNQFIIVIIDLLVMYFGVYRCKYLV